jgi:membrane-bound lytic murein transglycosylase B
MAAAQMIGEGHASRNQLRGSWAGAMGHTSSSRDLPEPRRGRRRRRPRDIWNSPADGLASAANLLRKAAGARRQLGGRGGRARDSFDYSVTETLAAPPSEWWRRGVRGRRASLVRGRPGSEARLILPAGAERSRPS